MRLYLSQWSSLAGGCISSSLFSWAARKSFVNGQSPTTDRFARRAMEVEGWGNVYSSRPRVGNWTLVLILSKSLLA
jgi:hypothetical protein